MSRRAPLGHSGRPRLGTVPPRPRRTPPPARCPAQAATTGLAAADPARRPASVAQASPARYGEGADSRPAGHRTTPLSHHVNADTYRGRAGPRAPGWASPTTLRDVASSRSSGANSTRPQVCSPRRSGVRVIWQYRLHRPCPRGAAVVIATDAHDGDSLAAEI